MRPFGKTLQYSLENTRIDNEDNNFILLILEDYCSPLLAMERKSELNRYFDDIEIRHVASEEAWDTITDNSRLCG
jgi:hypothetical protein